MTAEQLYPPFPPALLEAIDRAREVIVVGHANPDGDCIFSELAMKEILTSLGKSVTLANEGPFDRDEIKAYEGEFTATIPDDLIARRPLVVIVDCSTPDRPGELMRPLMDLETIVLDHHSSGSPFAKEGMGYIQPASVSTTMIVDALRRHLNVPLTGRLARCLYKGFATDTGFFHFINAEVGGETLRRVAAFVDEGVSPYELYDEMHDGRPLSYFKALAALMDRVVSLKDGALLYTWQGIDEEIEGKPADDIYAQLLQVAGVKAVLFFKEKEGHVDVGMRSKRDSGLDIGAFAAAHGGGGHRYAAGARIDGSLDDVMRRTVEDLIPLLD